MTRHWKAIVAILRGNRGSLAFTESLALKAVSLLLALILWITILGFKREEIKKNVKLEPLLPPGVMIVNKIPAYIQFTLSGPRVLLKDVERKIQPIRPDLRRGRDRLVTFSVSEDLIGELPVGVRVVAYYPPQVNIQLEEIIERYVPVSPTLKGATAEGYEVASVHCTPAKVAVSGPRSLVNQLDAVGTEPIDIEGLKTSKETDAEVEVDTSQGYELSRDKLVRVRVNTKRVN
jgi:hypothetical protein